MMQELMQHRQNHRGTGTQPRPGTVINGQGCSAGLLSMLRARLHSHYRKVQSKQCTKRPRHCRETQGPTCEWLLASVYRTDERPA